MNEFGEKVAVVTGAAAGIGRALAARCVSEGLRVVLADVEEEALAATERELRADGAIVLSVRTDVAELSDVDALARESLSRFGAVHFLFNNAGVGLVGPTTWESTVADWKWVLGVNLWGLIHALRVFVPILLGQAEPSHIVNTASTAGLVPTAGMAAYSAVEHAVVSLSETLHQELREQGARVKVSVLCPGLVNTRFLEASRNRPASLQNPLTEEIKREVRHASELAAVRQAAASGMSTDDLARLAFDAIRDERLYVLTHPWIKEAARERAEWIAEGWSPAGLPSPAFDGQ